jgi:hypothetical protein
LLGFSFDPTLLTSDKNSLTFLPVPPSNLPNAVIYDYNLLISIVFNIDKTVYKDVNACVTPSYSFFSILKAFIKLAICVAISGVNIADIAVSDLIFAGFIEDNLRIKSAASDKPSTSFFSILILENASASLLIASAADIAASAFLGVILESLSTILIRFSTCYDVFSTSLSSFDKTPKPVNKDTTSSLPSILTVISFSFPEFLLSSLCELIN